MKLKRQLPRIPAWFLLGFVALLYFLPFLLMLTNSLMSQAEIVANYADAYPVISGEAGFHYAEYKFIPEKVTLSQYKGLLFESPEYLNKYINSIKLTIPIVFFQIVVGLVAAFGFTVSRFRFKEQLFYVYLVVMVLPYQATVVSNYITADKLSLVDSYLAIILPCVFSPFPVFILRQSMKSIPSSLFEAAMIDGAGVLQQFFYVAVPLVKGGIASLFVLSFIECWSMVEQPMIFIRDTAKEPLSVYLASIGQNNMGLVFAASVLYLLPALWVFLYGQDSFEAGIQLSAFK